MATRSGTPALTKFRTAVRRRSWKIIPGTYRPDPNEMTDFNVLTFNAKAFPGTAPLVAKLGEKVRKEVVDKATAEASAVVSRAQEEIVRQKEKGIQEMKDTIATLSVQIAGRVLEKEVNEATHRQLVENLIKDLAKVRK